MMPETDPASAFDPHPPMLSMAAGVSDIPAVGDFTRLALWMAGALAGMTSPTHSAQRRYFRAMARRLGWPVGKALSQPRPGMASAMPLLTDAIIGTSRAAISSVFGPPRCALAEGQFVNDDAVWSGDVWYYAISNPAASAVSIEFNIEEAAGRLVFISFTPNAIS